MHFGQLREKDKQLWNKKGKQIWMLMNKEYKITKAFNLMMKMIGELQTIMQLTKIDKECNKEFLLMLYEI